MKTTNAAGTPGEIPGCIDARAAPFDLLSLEQVLRNAVVQAPIGIAFANRDGRYRYCNQAFCSMLGFRAEELDHKSIAALTLADDLESTTIALERLWRGDIAHLDVEKRYVSKGGNALWVRVTTSLVRNDSGQAVCSVELLRDISARTKMAAALLQSRTLLAAVIAELPQALLACDVTGRVTHYNRAAAELFGIPTDEPAALATNAYPITSLVCGPDGATLVPREDRPMARALRGEDVSDVELVIVRPDGGLRATLCSARRLLGPAGQALGAVAVVHDITERRHAEQELEDLHKQLLVASRHAGMAEVATNVLHNVGNVLNSVNVCASLVAERISKSKCARVGQVAALLMENVGDLASFLAGPQGRHVSGYLQELAGDLVRERDAVIAELSALRANVEHVKEIVAMQQNYAKRGGIAEILDIRMLVEDSLRMNAGAFSRHGVTIIRDYEDAPPIQVDKHKVLQILVNVIRNAKYACEEATAEKRITIRIRAANESVLISVVDTGIGIPKENLQRIFGHGFTTRADGHGFGLHSSALAAKEMGGTLHAESGGTGRGATFTLALPLGRRELLDAK